jgi:hypothetical protein
VASCAGALSAAVGINAGNKIIESDFHDRITIVPINGRGFAGKLNKGNFRRLAELIK